MKTQIPSQPQSKLIMLVSFALLNLSISMANAQNTFPATGAVGIGTTSPNASSLLEIKSTSKGFLAPRMTLTQRNAIGSPATGLLIYQTNSTPGFYYYAGSAWKTVSGTTYTAGTGISISGTTINNSAPDKTVVLAAGAGISVAGTYPNFTISNTGSSNGWSLTGNTGTNPATNFVGTTDAQPLIFKVNNAKAGSVEYDPAKGNTSFGYQGLYSNSSGIYNTAVGYQTLWQNDGNNNTAFGTSAMYDNYSGNANTATGSASLFGNISGTSNTASGYFTLSNNTTGNYNTATGSNALIGNYTGSYNTATGYFALSSSSSGSYNTAVGYSADVVGNQSNATAIGYDAGLNISNGCVIGNASVTLIGGVVGWSTLSDGRFKRNLQNNVPGLSFITQLKPVTYTLDIKALNKFSGADDRRKQLNDRQKKDKASNTVSDAVIDNAIKQKESILYTGFVAQEVERAANKSGYNFSGIHKPQNDKDNYSLDYSSFVVPLVKAVQELSAKNDDLQKQVDDLKAMVLAGGNSNTSSKTSAFTTLTDASLDQNNPNPFSNTTTIGYSLPQKFTAAQITITDKNGKILKQTTVSGSGKGTIHIDAAMLAAGAYNYSLLVDGKLIGTKQMLLSK